MMPLNNFHKKEEQVSRVRHNLSVRVQQLETQIQEKLDQARERREVIEREQKEKLREHVSFLSHKIYLKQINKIYMLYKIILI